MNTIKLKKRYSFPVSNKLPFKYEADYQSTITVNRTKNFYFYIRSCQFAVRILPKKIMENPVFSSCSGLNYINFNNDMNSGLN